MKSKGFECLKLFWSVWKLPILSIKLKYPVVLKTFQTASFHFIQFWWKHNSFTRIYAFIRNNTSKKRCFYNHSDICLFCFTYTYMKITLYLADFAGDKTSVFDFSDACLFVHPVYFDIYQHLLNKLHFRLFIPMFYCRKVTRNTVTK